MKSLIESKIQELVEAYSYDAQILRDFAEFIQAQKRSKTKKPKAPSMAELKSAVFNAFNCTNTKELRKNTEFKLATAGKKLNLRQKESWLILYREWVGIPSNERNEVGPTCINGIDVLKNFRPWQVFDLDSETATTDDINAAFRKLSKQYHPDLGGDRRVFEELKKMRDSVIAFR